MPVASGSRPGAVPSVYENTPTKIPLPSAAPLSLRKHASKSLGNLAAIARGDIGPSMPLTSANPSFPGNLYHNPIELDRTPAKQVAGGSSSIRSRKDRFGRNSIGSPGDLKQKYMHIGEDITMASANGGHYISPAMFRQNAAVAGLDDGDIGDNSAMASPFLLSKGPYGGRPRKSSLVGQGGISGLRQAAASASNSGAGQTPAEVLAQQRQQIQAPAPVSAASSASASTHSAHSAPTSYALEKRQATNDAVQATPAKWSPDDPDLPSPFLRRMTTAPAVVTTTAPSNGTVGSAASVPAQHHSQPFRSARERLALGPISVPNATAAGAIADVASGVSKLGIRPKSSAPPGTTGMSAIPRSKSGNLHQYALNRAASEEKVAKTGPVSGAGAGVGSMGYARSRTNGRG
jgi:NIMA (never in mitosis gene a)-related kinase